MRLKQTMEGTDLQFYGARILQLLETASEREARLTYVFLRTLMGNALAGKEGGK